MKKRNAGQEILNGIREIKEFKKDQKSLGTIKLEDTMIKDHNPKLSSKCMKIIECDTARISKVGGKLFLIIGFNKNTKDDSAGQCFINGEPVDYDYVAEKVIASGKTENELIKSTKEYSGLCEITIFEYLTEKANEEKKDSYA